MLKHRRISHTFEQWDHVNRNYVKIFWISYHKIFHSVFLFCQVLGHFPYDGVRSKNYQDISFSFKSFTFLFSFFIKIIAIIEFITEIVRRQLKHNNFNLENYTIFVLNGLGIPLGIYLIWLSYHWRKHMEFWCENEQKFSRKIYHGEKYFKKFKKQITVLFFVIMGYKICELNAEFIVQLVP